MSTRTNFKPIQDPGRIRHEWDQAEQFKDIIWDRTGVRCEVVITKEKVILTTADLADYFLAKAEIKGRTSLEVCRDLKGKEA